MDREIAMPMEDREFNEGVAAHRNQMGAFSRMVAAADLYRRGYVVSKPLGDGTRYDLVADRNGSLSRLQVKTLSKSGQASLGFISYREDTYGRGQVQRTLPKYGGTEFDFLVAVDRNTFEAFYVPASEIDFSKASLSLNAALRQRYSAF